MKTYKIELRHSHSKNRLNALRNNRLSPLTARLPADEHAIAWAQQELTRIFQSRRSPEYRYVEAGLWELLPLGPTTIDDGVTANCVIPGYTLTGAWSARADALAAAEGLSFEAALQEILRRQDMGHSRWGQAGEIADVVVFLLSAQAGFVNGASFRVDGGQFLAVQR